jgi:hypothetical protein
MYFCSVFCLVVAYGFENDCSGKWKRGFNETDKETLRTIFSGSKITFLSPKAAAIANTLGSEGIKDIFPERKHFSPLSNAPH